MLLTKDYLIAHGWRVAEPNVVKDFRDFRGELYRIGWNPDTKVLYLGYGQAPILVKTTSTLIAILGTFLFLDEAKNLME